MPPKSLLKTILASVCLVATWYGPRSFAEAQYGELKDGVDTTPTAHFASQAWLPEVRARFYFTPQGSKVIPYEWAMALTTVDGNEAFFSSAHLKKYGYIPQGPSELNQDALPVGFTRDDHTAGFTNWDSLLGKVPKYATLPQLGINCAACHTSELSYKGTKFRIEGGPSYSNFQMFTKEMDEAVNKVATANQEGEPNYDAFFSFAQRYATRAFHLNLASVGSKQRLAFLASLRAQLAEFNQTRQTWQNNNGLKNAGITYGPARNDAFGVIFNQALGVFLDQPENIRAPNAPVKYPVIWDAPYHEVVQWVGIARNSKEAGGPIARNIGQVLGVFGHTDVQTQSLDQGYCTSAKRAELNEIEDWVRTLRSPTWPKQALGFDESKALRGEVLYRTQRCLECHALPERSLEEAKAHREALGLTQLNVFKTLSYPERKANEKMIDIEGADGVHTDALTAVNASSYTAKTGILKDRKLRVLMGRPLEEREPRATLLRHVDAGSILGSFSYLTCANTPRDGEANLGLAQRLMDKLLGFTKEDSDGPDLQSRVKNFQAALSKYKARPLNGIWAAPPYLHNGSVRSLKQLLTAPALRETAFDFNCNELDPVNVGVNCTPDTVSEQNRTYAGQFRFSARDEQGNLIPGNSNLGHDFGTSLSEDEKMDLIEYIKAL